MNYWESQKRLKEVYDRATKDSGVSWHEEYLKEKTKRIEIEEKYERLTRKIKENAIKEVAEREIKDIDEAEFGKLVEVRLDDDCEPVEWDDERMDIIGQNGNTGDHYNEIDFGAGNIKVKHILKK